MTEIQVESSTVFDQEIDEILQVKDDDDQSIVYENQENQENQPNKAFVPAILKTRAGLIKKIKEVSIKNNCGAEVKKMRLHRRRRASLDNILREQVDKMVTDHAEKQLGIPPTDQPDKRLDYAVDMCYKMDLCVMQLTEKIVNYLNVGVTLDGLTKTIDSSPEIKNEVKSCIKEFIVDNDFDWIKEYSSPGTRLLLAHLYPIMACLREKEKVKKPKEVFPNMKSEMFKAKIKSIIKSPSGDQLALPKNVCLV